MSAGPRGGGGGAVAATGRLVDFRLAVRLPRVVLDTGPADGQLNAAIDIPQVDLLGGDAEEVELFVVVVVAVGDAGDDDAVA